MTVSKSEVIILVETTVVGWLLEVSTSVSKSVVLVYVFCTVDSWAELRTIVLS